MGKVSIFHDTTEVVCRHQTQLNTSLFSHQPNFFSVISDIFHLAIIQQWKFSLSLFAPHNTLIFHKFVLFVGEKKLFGENSFLFFRLFFCSTKLVMIKKYFLLCIYYFSFSIQKNSTEILQRAASKKRLHCSEFISGLIFALCVAFTLTSSTVCHATVERCRREKRADSMLACTLRKT